MDNGTRPPRHDGVDSDNVDTLAARSVSKNGEDVGKASHGRSLSGGTSGSLLSFKPSTEDRASKLQPQIMGTKDITGKSPKEGASIDKYLRQSQGRKKGASLRKAAMLGTQNLDHHSSAIMSEGSPDESVQQQFSYEKASLNSSSDSGWTPDSTAFAATSAVSNPQSANDLRRSAPQLLESHIASPVNAYASTTDDDEGISFFHSAASSSLPSYTVAQLPSQGSAMLLHRRHSNRSSQKNSSLATTHTPVGSAIEEEWDYSETEWWGWVVLIVTWMVFVVGMGSCLGVWSWAWDVGETPYAPPELEDDPTLPIVGYYPALIVCTAVMAWVWVVVAWVGMKYFRHSKVVVEDG